MYTRFLKPFFDKLSALLVLVLVSPILFIVLVILAISNRGHIWFIQTRPGKNGKLFDVIKFKTMTDEQDSNGVLLSDEKRLTGIGKFIRKTSLDELPQLVNVIIGNMSIVGPRPLLVEYLALYNAQQQRRHEVKPGITGWAQVNGRNTVAWKERFELDVWYVEHISFWVDVKILLQTVNKVFRAEGINSANAATMERFKGND
ncbi:MAG: sugar transferase [Cytophagales bacterium]|nr:sugar transferase [Cytophagales bacterium]MCA6368021.1 sugar transferase [Cytophagales bacterium]MCA6370501.1 sugar transferase [Cytophagales bacterium]MCA6376594.1 sugar transferase [Cytophagales bacterium]MCA6384424.1 sugar transferase [Cytophagales bacterium]